jgi:hypothetical protein
VAIIPEVVTWSAKTGWSSSVNASKSVYKLPIERSIDTIGKEETMKLIKTLSALAFALALVATPALADEHKQGGCCKKATESGKECTHKCCVDAAKKGNECEKCGGKGKIPVPEKKKQDS